MYIHAALSCICVQVMVVQHPCECKKKMIGTGALVVVCVGWRAGAYGRACVSLRLQEEVNWTINTALYTATVPLMELVLSNFDLVVARGQGVSFLVCARARV